ncbi:hypothetical protein AX774_g478 [Zancudomyces culisetae]|uniref:Uncharacterized protein n=1 Tax=Zancudomyces culisetae TaxID=1213189 RepID=A0A1R1PYH8_ZANCU|nr:hypothetical protein AX774_g478 [Zancudomyces culisetae]|eukprot:OMH85969.1 hypothetical protein AX774_g478 [Zancudomyces culisetae]
MKKKAGCKLKDHMSYPGPLNIKAPSTSLYPNTYKPTFAQTKQVIIVINCVCSAIPELPFTQNNHQGDAYRYHG